MIRKHQKKKQPRAHLLVERFGDGVLVGLEVLDFVLGSAAASFVLVLRCEGLGLLQARGIELGGLSKKKVTKDCVRF